MSQDRVAILEGKMERVSAQLEFTNAALGKIDAKLDRIVGEGARHETDLAVMKGQIAAISSHMDLQFRETKESISAIVSSVAELQSIRDGARGGLWSLNALWTAVTIAAAAFAWWKAK